MQFNWLNYIAIILGCILSTSSAWAAQLLAIKAGEEAQLNRIVLISDQPQNWSVSIHNQQLRIHSQQATTQLTRQVALPKSGITRAVQVNKENKGLRISAQLMKPVEIKRSYQLAARKGVKPSFVIEFVPAKANASAQKSQPKTTSQPSVTAAKTTPAQPKKPIALTSQQLKQSAKSATTAALDNLNVVAVKPLSVAPFKGTKSLVVAIDAGHGGKDVGAISASGMLEKDLTLTMAKELKRQIDALPNMTAVLTRQGDYFVPLAERAKIARQLKADVFISLHADAHRNRQISGASFYIASDKGASSQLARFVAQHANQSARLDNGVEVWSQRQANHIGQVALQRVQDDSLVLGNQLKKGFQQSGIRLQYSQVQSANFLVLKNFDMPSVLVEMGFISNPKQDQQLQLASYQQKLVNSLVNGLVGFVEQQPEPGVVYANIKVMKGDNLSKLAQRHSTSVDYLMKANQLSNPSAIQIGQVLKVPVNMSQRVMLAQHQRG